MFLISSDLVLPFIRSHWNAGRQLLCVSSQALIEGGKGWGLNWCRASVTPLIAFFVSNDSTVSAYACSSPWSNDLSVFSLFFQTTRSRSPFLGNDAWICFQSDTPFIKSTFPFVRIQLCWTTTTSTTTARRSWRGKKRVPLGTSMDWSADTHLSPGHNFSNVW